jgi:hypothetical protein
MNSWLEIFAIVPVLISLFLAYKYISLRRQLANAGIMLLQSSADNELLKKQILQTIEDKKLIESEEFMAFLSKSREDAFSYIEKAQAEILKFDTVIFEASIKGIDSNDALKRVLEANKELQKLLPDNIKNNNVQGEL